MEELKKCKKHNCYPMLYYPPDPYRKPFTPWDSSGYYGPGQNNYGRDLPPSPKPYYRCEVCEQEKYLDMHIEKVNDWNRKQS